MSIATTAYWCKKCQKVHYGKLPPEVEKGGLFAPRLRGASRLHEMHPLMLHFPPFAKYIRDVLAVKVSRGHIADSKCPVARSRFSQSTNRGSVKGRRSGIRVLM